VGLVAPGSVSVCLCVCLSGQVVAVWGSWHLGQLQVGLSRAIRICQCTCARITTSERLPMQVARAKQFAAGGKKQYTDDAPLCALHYWNGILCIATNGVKVSYCACHIGPTMSYIYQPCPIYIGATHQQCRRWWRWAMPPLSVPRPMPWPSWRSGAQTWLRVFVCARRCQVDGEPWQQPPAVLEVSFKGNALVLRRLQNKPLARMARNVQEVETPPPHPTHGSMSNMHHCLSQCALLCGCLPHPE
jgi:Diacylglycerol kinase accessory domain